jgi:hypothetical protein
MTAQLRNKETMQERTSHPDFLYRWLNGDLTEAELASLRNREEYEEMVVSCKAGVTLATEKNPKPMPPVSPAKESHVGAKSSNAFAIFVAITIVAVAAVVLFVKSSGWF